MYCNSSNLSQNWLYSQPVHIKKKHYYKHINQIIKLILEWRFIHVTVRLFFFHHQNPPQDFYERKWNSSHTALKMRQPKSESQAGFKISTQSSNNYSFAAANLGILDNSFTSSCWQCKLSLTLLYRVPSYFPLRLALDAVFMRATGGAGQTAPGGR